MEEELKKMLNQECPQCKSVAGDINSYMPIIKDDDIEIEIICENCGCYGKFKGKLIDAEFKINI